MHIRRRSIRRTVETFWGAKGAPILFSEIGFCMVSCSYIYICICDHPWEKGVWVNFGQYEIIASVHSSGLNASIYVD